MTGAEAVSRITGGGELTSAEILDLLEHSPRTELFEAAHRVTEAFKAKNFDFCGILNARSGKCGENCKWCAQSAHWHTDCEVWDLRSADECLAAAKAAEANGAVRFALVTSGRAFSDSEIDKLCAIISRMSKETKLCPCASLGLVSKAALAKLKAAGLKRYHCNLETAPSHFPKLCTTHTVEEKLATLRAAKECGLEVCCGGILGMGESLAELVEFAFALRKVGPDSIPINFLHPIPGTPLGGTPPLAETEILTGVSVIRLVNPRLPLRFAGGRRDMSDATAARAIYVGISAGIAGPLLTTPGAVYADDRQLALEAGYAVACCAR